MAEDKQPQKIGAGHASAMLRLGLAELRASMYPGSNIAQPNAIYGIWGTKTPGEVMQDKEGESRDPDERPSILNERLQQVEQVIAEQQPQLEPEPPPHERE